MYANFLVKTNSITPKGGLSWVLNKLFKTRKQSISYCYEGYTKKLVAPKQHITIFQNQIYGKKLFHSDSSLLTINSSYLKEKSLSNLKMGNTSTRRNRRLKSTRANLNSLATSNNCDDSSTKENNSTVNCDNSQMVITNTAMPKEVFYTDTPRIRAVAKQFPIPKVTLHNFYQLFYGENNKTVSLSPSYKIVKDGKNSKWICTYHVSWPEEVKFQAKDVTKKEASLKAALAALDWLKEEHKITEDGAPIIYDKEQVRQITKKTIPSFVLSPKASKNIQQLIEIYENELLPSILSEKGQDNSSDSSLNDSAMDVENLNAINTRKRPFLNINTYMSKEKVDLPIAKYKDQFIDLLKNNQTIIVRGQPGCGKSTRIPQYVLEAWAQEGGLLGKTGLIAVTQPRRIAAISLAERVASERDEMVGKIVGYQVRLNTKFRPDTGRILYCTTGILLRHLQSDNNLSKFSHIILDEAHERDVNTDLLMNLVRSSLKKNPDLKLIVMSATIDTDMFSKYFNDAAVMDVPGFTYPVEDHFLDTCKIDMSKTLKMCDTESPTVVHDEVVKVIEYIHRKKPEGAILCFLPGWEDISKIYNMIPKQGDVSVHCLHSRLQDSEQWKIFSNPPPGVRKIILATNLAETSVTIDDVVYVVDTGIRKDLRFDVEKGVNCIDNHWISKASARQRKGRAGRVKPGESYHLYTRQKHESFDEYSIPEIQTTSLNKILLDCKVFSNNMNAIEFMNSLPTPPDESATIRAVNELTELELLDENENLTSLGKVLAEFQLEPKLSKAMVNAVVFKCVTPIVDIVTLFSAETEYFVSGLMDKQGVKQTKQSYSRTSDHLAMMRLFEKWLEYKDDNNVTGLRLFCEKANIVPHKMNTVEKLRNIHFDYLYNGLLQVFPISDDMSDNDEMVKGVLFSGVGSALQHRTWDIVKQRLKNNVNVFLTSNNHRATITPESVNFKRRSYPSNFFMYINETRSNVRRTTLVRECSLIPSVSVLLFSNKPLIQKKAIQEISNDIPSENQVELILKNTNIKFLCDEQQAEQILKLKDAIRSSHQYHIKQLTDSGDYSPDFQNSWDSFLLVLNNLLNEFAIPK